MNSKVHPLIVVVVVLATLLAVGIWMWGSGKAKQLGGPAELRVGPEGHLFVQIQNQLLEHDTDGVFIHRHDLAALDVERMLGAYAFFSDGDILLRRGPDPRGVLDNVRAYRRQTNDQSLAPETPDAGLYRCRLETAECTRFGDSGIDFKAAHGIVIDPRSDEVYISDTTRHRLLKFSAAGEALASTAVGWKFPNQLLLHRGRLAVANTNLHQVRVVDSQTEPFGTDIEVIDTVPRAAAARGQTWPSHIARVGNDWWVNNMRAGMNEGGIYIFDESWQYKQRVALPEGADPISLVPFQGAVLISDWNNDRIYRASPRGELLRDFTSPGLADVLAESRALRRRFEMYSYLGIALFFLLLAGLGVRGLAASLSHGTGRRATAQ